jgi:PAS domain S-box-containing protein
MCIKVIKQEADIKGSFYTKGGSFYINGTTKFLAAVTKKDKSKTCNICNKFGYESVALIPVLTGKRVRGLIHLADKKKNMLSLKNVELLEIAAIQLGEIMPRILVEEDIKRREKRYSLAQKAANIGSWDLDILTSDLIWSERIEPIFGFKAGKFKGTYQAFLDCVHPDDRRFVVDSFNMAIEENKGYAIEHRIVWPDGTVRWVSEDGDIIKDKNGKAVRMLGIVQDVTERKMAEEKIKNLAKFPSENPFPVLRITEDNILTYANNGAKPFLKDWKCGVGQKIPEYLHKVIRTALKSGKLKNIEVKYKNRFFLFVITPVSEAGYVNIYGSDITERKKVQEALEKDKMALVKISMDSVEELSVSKQSEKDLKIDKDILEKLVNEKTKELLIIQKNMERTKRLSEIGTLASTIAHELRNPLGAIQMTTYNISKKGQDISLDSHLNNIEDKVLECNQIISNLLNHVRIKRPNYKSVRINDIMEQCIDLAKHRFLDCKISIDRQYGSLKKDVIECDPVYITEVFNNILNNACESFKNKKGKIKIKIAYNDKGEIRISFRDNGIGIDKKDLDMIFEPFFTRKPKGVGLGMAVCKEMVNLHEGEIEIESRKGRGTVVTVTLPKSRPV